MGFIEHFFDQFVFVKPPSGLVVECVVAVGLKRFFI
jgi:hypothetical protein